MVLAWLIENRKLDFRRRDLVSADLSMVRP
jgi:hypothetical protein